MRRVRIPAVVGLALLSGCEFPGRRDETSELGPTAQRLRAAYSDLGSGRFVILADFESSGDAELFRVAAADGSDPNDRQPSISILRARNKTGAGGLKTALSGAGETVWLDGRRSQSQALPSDWRKYALLIASVYGPDDGVMLDVAIHSGEAPRSTWRTRLRIDAGWNLLRIDLAAAVPQIDLADVRAVSWSAPQIAGPIDLYFDDIVLADNERSLVNPSDAPDELYAISRGRRLYVGAAGRFELAFSDGVIAAWHPSRKSRQVNLTVETGLGPWPVALQQTWATATRGWAYDDPNMFSDWGDRVAAGQAVVESSGFRVVLVGQWRYNSSDSSPTTQPSSPPGHRWQYTVYPSGKVYVQLTTDNAGFGWPAPALGAAVALNGRYGFKTVEAEAANADRARSRFVLLSNGSPEGRDFLWAPHDAELSAERRVLESGDRSRIAVVSGAASPAEKADSAHMFRVWPTDLDGISAGDSLVRDYRHPVRIEPTFGARVEDAAGDLDRDGFNESQGCYELSPDAGVLRFKFDPGRMLRHRPVFRIHVAASDRCWVYIDGRIVERTGRDAAGRLMFEIPRIVQQPLAVEIHVRSG